MKLIEDLGTMYPKPTSKTKTHYGIYECPNCYNHFKAVFLNVKKGKVSECGVCRNTKHGDTNTKDYSRWTMMKQRCFNESNANFHRYGGRGITVCDEWINNFQAYKTYISSLDGYGDSENSIDRIDNDGNYEIGNLRWANKSVQAQNTRVLYTSNTIGYRGVRNSKHDTFNAIININKKQIGLGTFKTAVEAAKAYDKYVLDNNLEHTINGA